MAIKFKEQPG